MVASEPGEDAGADRGGAVYLCDGHGLLGGRIDGADWFKR